MAERLKSTRGRKPTLTDSGRKRHRKEVTEKWNKSRVYIGDQFDRWNEFKSRIGMKTHSEVAKILIDSYESKSSISAYGNQSSIESVSEVVVTSTPGPSKAIARLDAGVSDISHGSGNEESEMSGVEILETHHDQKKRKIEYRHNSFVDPCDLSIDISEEVYSDGDNSSDEDYEPSFNVTLRPTIQKLSEELGDSEIDDDSESDTTNQDQPEVDLGPGVRRIRDVADIDDGLVSDKTFIVYKKSLLELAATNIPRTCSTSECKEQLQMTAEIIGSAVYLKWICVSGHLYHRWCSQPILNRRLHGGDLMLTAAVFVSGNNYKKIQMFARCLNLPIVSSSSFHKIQRTYVIPSIDQYWIDHSSQILNEFHGQDIVILGDGRMDSPGYSAQYCSYTFMEYTSKKILCIITMDKRATDRKSTNLEKACFIKGIQYLKDKGMKIVEVVTDCHLQITALMKNRYSTIKHSFDIWHGTKNLGKKIISVGQEKDKKALLEWSKDVVNHFWYCAQVSNTFEEFQGIWFGVLHHVVGEHEWILPYYSGGSNACRHGPLTEERDKNYLKQGSAAHEALRKIVMDKRLINNILHYLSFRSTAELENFQNLILVYASKRHSYNPPAYRARNRLAALDHNSHIEREVKINKDGSVRYQRSFNKKSSRWTVYPLKKEKTYAYIPQLLHSIVERRLQNVDGMNQNVVLDVDDPRRLSATLAAIPPPPTRQLVSEHKSRFSATGESDTTIQYWEEMEEH